MQRDAGDVLTSSYPFSVLVSLWSVIVIVAQKRFVYSTTLTPEALLPDIIVVPGNLFVHASSTRATVATVMSS